MSLTQSPPPSYLLAMRALQVQNQKLLSTQSTHLSLISSYQSSMQQLKQSLLDSQKQLLQKETTINLLLKQISEMKQEKYLLQDKCYRYAIMIQQSERDKENISKNFVERIINQKKITSRLYQQNSQSNNYLKTSKSSLQVSPLPCVLNIKTPSKTQLKSSIILQQQQPQTMVNSKYNNNNYNTSTLTLKHNNNNNNQQYYKLIAKLRIQKQKLLVIVTHQIQKLQRNIKNSNNKQQKIRMKIQKDEKVMYKERIQKELELL